MADPLAGFTPGITYGAYQDPNAVTNQLKKQEKELEKSNKKPSAKGKAAGSKKPATSQTKPVVRNKETWNPAKVVGDALKPVGSALMAPLEGLSKGMDSASAGLAGMLGESPQSYAKRQQEGTAKRAKIDASMKKETDPAKEMAKVVLKGTGLGILEETVNTASLIGDTLQQPIRKLTKTYDPKNDPFNDQYVRAATDLGITPKTVGGQKVARFLQFFNAARMTRRMVMAGIAKTTGKAQTVAQVLKTPEGYGAQTIVNQIPDAIGAFLVASPADPENLSSMVQDAVPDFLKPIFVLAAHGEDDNPWLIKLKGTAEDMFGGAFADSIMSLFKGRKAARAAKALGASDTDALAEGVAKMSDEADVLSKKADFDYKKEGENWNNTREVQLQNLLKKEASLLEQKQKLDPTDPFNESLSKQIDDDLAKNKLDQQEIDRAIIDNTPKEVWETEGKFRQENIPEAVVHGRTWVTDSGIKLLNATNSWTSIIEPAVKQLNPDALNQVYRTAGKAAWQQLRGEHLKAVADQFLEVMTTANSAEEAKDLAMGYLRQSGKTYSKQSGEMIEDDAVLVVQSAIQGLSEQLSNISKNLLDYDAAHATNGNQVDRVLDRWIGLMMLRKEAFTLDAGRRLLLAKFPGAQKLLSKAAEDATGLGDKMTPDSIMKYAEDLRHRIRSEDPGALDEIRTLATAMRLAGGDPALTMSYGQNVMRALGKVGIGYFYNNILSAPKTIFRNLGASIRVVLQPFAIGLIGTINGDDRLIGAAGAGVIGGFASIQDAFHVAAVTMRSGIPATWNAMSVASKAERMAMIDALVETAETPTQKIAAGAVKALHAISNFVDLPSKLLMGGDDFLKTVAVRQKIYEDAYLAAFNKMEDGSKLSFQALEKAAIDQYEKHVDFQTGQIKDEALERFAQQATYQEDPGEFITRLTGALDSIQPFQIPVGRFLFPFVHTPANIIKYQLEFTPILGKFMHGYKNAIRNNDTLAIAEYQGREAIGSFLVSFGYTHAWAGKITGNQPMDRDEREAWRKGGIQPRSVLIGDQWVSYNWFEPLSNWIAAAADLGHLERTGEVKEIDKVATRLSLAIGASFTAKTMLGSLDGLSLITAPYRTVAEFTKAKERFGEPTGAQDRAGSALLGSINTAIPLTGFRTALSRAQDEYYREYDSWVQKKLFDMNPFMSRHNVPFEISILTGKAILNPGGGIRNAMIPFEMSKVESDPVANKLTELKLWPTVDYTKTKGGLSLTAKDRNTLKELMWNNGALPAELKAWITSAAFKKSETGWKNRTMSRGEQMEEPIHIRETKRILADAYGGATQALIAAKPELQAKLQTFDQLRFAQSQGNYSSANEVQAEIQNTQRESLKRLIDSGNENPTKF
jgi:hypothetical protein